MSDTIIYHNPRCSKSRETLALLEQNNIDAEVVEYLKTPPTEDELAQIIKQLEISPRDLLRKGETLYKELGLSDKSIDDDALIKAMCENPKLIERPIVIHKNKAQLGRPPENVLTLL